MKMKSLLITISSHAEDYELVYPNIFPLEFLVKNFTTPTILFFSPFKTTLKFYGDFVQNEYTARQVKQFIGLQLMRDLPISLTTYLQTIETPVCYLLDNYYGYDVENKDFKFGQWYSKNIETLLKTDDVVLIYGDSKYPSQATQVSFATGFAANA